MVAANFSTVNHYRLVCANVVNKKIVNKMLERRLRKELQEKRTDNVSFFHLGMF